MKQTICDRCGEVCRPPYGTGSSVSLLLESSTGDLYVTNADLCEACKKELVVRNSDFLENKCTHEARGGGDE